MDNAWGSVEGVRAALAKSAKVPEGFDRKDTAHQRTWLALAPPERQRLLGAKGNTSLRQDVHVLAHDWMQKERTSDAQTLFEDLLAFSDMEEQVYCNALWAIMDDNSKLGVQPERARRWLAACLPHGPDNPAIYFNAACCYFELGDRDAVFEMIAKAKEHEYDGLEKIRDEKFLASLREDPRWESLFGHLDPPAVEDLAEALRDPKAVRKLELDGVKKELPEDIAKLTELEVLDVHFSDLKAVPVWLSTLPKLRKLELNWNYQLKELPDEVLAMPSLREISLYDSRLPKKYQVKQLNALLQGFAKASTPHAARMLHIALLLGDEKKALARGEVRDLLGALDSNVANVRAFALRVLEKKLGEVRLSVPEDGEVLLVGKLAADKDVIAERLAKLGATVGKKRSAETCAAVIGELPKGKAVELFDAGVPILLEAHLRAALDAGAPQDLAAGEDSAEIGARVGELLMSTDKGSKKLAIDMMKKGGVPKGVLEELLLVTQDTEADKKVREEAKKLLAQSAPRELQDAIKKVLARTSLYLSGETKVRSRIKAIAKQSKGAIDPIKLATLLLPARGYSYLFEVGRKDPAVAGKALAAMRKGDTLDLSGGELDELPAAIGELKGLKKLLLGQDHLTEIPEVILAMKDLEVLDLSGNRLSSIPDAIARLEELRELDIASNFIRAFPKAVFKLKKLRKLDVSTTRYGAHREIPLVELPEGIGALTNLEELTLCAHHFAALPASMKKLTKLRRLDLSSGKLGSVPEWVAELPALEELDLGWAEIANKESARAVAKALKARGAKVEGVP